MLFRGGRKITVRGENFDIIQQPMMSMWVEPVGNFLVRRRRYLSLKGPHVAFNSSRIKVHHFTEAADVLYLILLDYSEVKTSHYRAEVLTFLALRY